MELDRQSQEAELIVRATSSYTPVTDPPWSGAQTKRFSVLRLGTFPTVQRNGMGLPAYELAADSRYHTIYRAPTLDRREEPQPAPTEDVDLRFVPFPNPTMPADGRSLRTMALATSRRLAAVAGFTARVLLDSEARRADVVHIHSPMYAGVAAYAKLRGTPTVLTIHGTDFLRLRESPYLRATLSPIDRVLCVADWFVNELAMMLPSKPVSAVFNGVDIERFSRSHAPTSGRRKRIISVGSLRWHKDHGRLIEAFAAVAGRHTDWELIIVDDGELRGELEHAIAAAGIQGRAKLLGNLPQDCVARELAGSEVFALSSVTEGLPKVLLEAMASGCACVATDVGECGATVADTGLIVPPADTPALAEALDSLMSDFDLRRTLGDYAAARAQKFTWQAYRDRHFDIYKGLLASKR